MPNYMLAYHGGGMPETKEEGERVMAAWMAWMKDIGEDMVEPGNPVGKSTTVTANGATPGADNALMGYSIVRADTLDAALAHAAACPHLSMEGANVEVAEIIPM